MPAKSRRRSAAPRLADSELTPVLKPLLKPVVEPVLARLDRLERLLEDLKASLDVQFKRTAAIQAQVDHLAATLLKRRS